MGEANTLGDRTVFWLTGLSGAGKTTTALSLTKTIKQQGQPCVHLDGDTFRAGVSADLRYSDEDRRENIRRISEMAKLLCDQAFNVVVSCISPRDEHRQLAAKIIGPQRFRQVFVDTPLEVCERRDPKGLYARAKAGQVQNFTGIHSSFQRPSDNFLVIDAYQNPVEYNVARILNLLKTGVEITESD